MSLSPNAIPQLIIQEVDIRDGIDNNINQTIEQNITVYVLKVPTLPNLEGIQGFIVTNQQENNEVEQDILQIMGNFPLFPDYYSLSSFDPLLRDNINLNFDSFINNDGVLNTLQFDNQQIFIEGDDNNVNLFSKQIIYDLSWYQELTNNPDFFLTRGNFDIFSLVERLSENSLIDAFQVAVQDLIIDGNNNIINQSIQQTFSTFVFFEDDFSFDLTNPENLQPIQFIFQESFVDSENNLINQNINQNIHLDFTFSQNDFYPITKSNGQEIVEPLFDIDEFILPILDNKSPDSEFFANHEVKANNRSFQLTDILGNRNSDTKFSNQINLFSSEGETLLKDESEEDLNSETEIIDLINEVQNLVLTGDESRLTQNNLGSLFTQILDIVETPMELNSPIYRFQNSDRPGTYLFAGVDESNTIRRDYPNFIEEGFAFNVSFEEGDDLIRFNRFQNSSVPGTYLYAAEEESESIRANYPNFVEEGIAFYALEANANQGIDFYRFQNTQQPGTYIFVGETERQSILANFPNFIEEGIAFEVGI